VLASLKTFLLLTFCAVLHGQILADGHVHITNRVYWESIDPVTPEILGENWLRVLDSAKVAN